MDDPRVLMDAHVSINNKPKFLGLPMATSPVGHPQESAGKGTGIHGASPQVPGPSQQNLWILSKTYS